MKFVKNIVFFLFLINASSAFGQVLKLKSTAYSSKYKVDYSWTDWAEWEKANILITLDLNRERITIYSGEKQVYDIAENEGKKIDNDGDETLSLYCVDNDGLTCRVRIVTLHSNGEQLQVYVDYKDMKWVYNVYVLD